MLNVRVSGRELQQLEETVEHPHFERDTKVAAASLHPIGQPPLDDAKTVNVMICCPPRLFGIFTLLLGGVLF